jgi:CBS domain-containing protein
MTRELVTVTADDGLEDAVRRMDEHDVRHLAVVDGARLVGVLSDRDLLGATGWIPGESWRNRPESPAREDPRRVRDALRSRVIAISPDRSLGDAARELAKHRIGCLPVVEGGKLVGILTTYDVLEQLYLDLRSDRTSARNPPASKCMTATPKTLPPGSTLAQARELLVNHGVRHAPIVDGSRLVGLVSDRDLRMGAGRGYEPSTPVEQVIPARTLTCPLDEPLARMARTMVENKIECLPVLMQGELVGVVTSLDLLVHGAVVFG